jgi:hypothetical protein
MRNPMMWTTVMVMVMVMVLLLLLKLKKRRDTHYDTMNCPDAPPTGYPYAWNMVGTLDGLASTIPPPSIYQAACAF